MRDLIGYVSAPSCRTSAHCQRSLFLTDNDQSKTTWHYDLAGRALVQILPNGQQQDNYYDEVGRLTRRHLFKRGNTSVWLATFLLEHDAAGNVIRQDELWPGDHARTSTMRTSEMAYDDISRLTSETVTADGQPTKQTLYTYGAASNRATKVEKENGVAQKHTHYHYNDANQLTAWQEKDGSDTVITRSAVLTYDTRGNRISQLLSTPNAQPSTATTTYTWTSQNRLASVMMPGAVEHRYTYDYRARRIGRSEPDGAGGTRHTVITFNGGLSAAEHAVASASTYLPYPAPNRVVRYQRGPDMGGGVGGLLYSLRSTGSGGGSPPSVKFNLSNTRGDVVAQSDSTGALTWTASYEAYGKRPVETGTNADRQRANTKEEDPTGLLNEGFRYRDLETGIWLSRDPAGFVDGPNLYAYVRQNPWTAFDPDGLFLREHVPTWMQWTIFGPNSFMGGFDATFDNAALTGAVTKADGVGKGSMIVAADATGAKDFGEALAGTTVEHNGRGGVGVREMGTGE